MKNLMGAMEGGSIPALSNLEESLKADQKVLLSRVIVFSIQSSLCSRVFLVSNLLVMLATSWYCKEKKASRVEKAIRRLSSISAWPSWFWWQFVIVNEELAENLEQNEIVARHLFTNSAELDSDAVSL